MTEYIRDCVVCNKQFKTNKSQQICCSGECAKERHRIMMKERYNPKYTAKRKEKEMYTKECIVCGKTFETETKQKMMCSAECREKRDRMMRRIYQKDKRMKKREQKRRKNRISELAMIERLAREHGLTYGAYVGLYEYR